MVEILQLLSNIDRNLLMFAIVLLLTIEVFLLSFPKEVVMIYAGFAFGLFGGSILNLLGLVGAIVLGYEGGRLGKFGLEKLRGHRLISKYERELDQRGMVGLTLLRLFPLTPNDILTIACGFLEVKRLPYLLISTICAIPYAILWAYVGNSGLSLIMELFPSTYDLKTWVVSFILVLLIFWIIGTKMFEEA